MNKPRILVVEDELLIRLFLVESLEEAGYTVVEAASGDEALAELERQAPFQLVLTDLQMPGEMDGRAVARKAREREPDTAIIYMTGRPDVLQQLGPTGGRESVLLKPYGPSQVLAAVKRVLQ